MEWQSLDIQLHLVKQMGVDFEKAIFYISLKKMTPLGVIFFLNHPLIKWLFVFVR